MATTAAKITTGRRKEAVARVRLIPGTGNFDINGRSLDDYFPTRVHRMVAVSALRLVGREKDFDVIVTIRAAASPARPVRSVWAPPGRCSTSTRSSERS